MCFNFNSQKRYKNTTFLANKKSNGAKWMIRCKTG